MLPGAFSLYRLAAIQGKPLRDYFKGLMPELRSCFLANLYLAEDRIMCLEVLTHQGQRNKLAFVPGSTALTDPPTSVADLLRQRRRWINGSNFAQLYVIRHFCALKKTTHSCCAKTAIFAFYLYYILNSAFTFILVGLFHAGFSLLLRQFLSTRDPLAATCSDTPSVVSVLDGLYLALLLWILLVSLSVDLRLVRCQLTFLAIA